MQFSRYSVNRDELQNKFYKWWYSTLIELYALMYTCVNIILRTQYWAPTKYTLLRLYEHHDPYTIARKLKLYILSPGDKITMHYVTSK